MVAVEEILPFLKDACWSDLVLFHREFAVHKKDKGRLRSEAVALCLQASPEELEDIHEWILIQKIRRGIDDGLKGVLKEKLRKGCEWSDIRHWVLRDLGGYDKKLLEHVSTIWTELVKEEIAKLTGDTTC